MAAMSSPWMAPAPHSATQPAAGAEDLGMQARPMGLKVHYCFDRDSQVHCLARWPHILQIQTIPLDERTTIGVVDLRICLQAVSQSSPELLNQHENDYSVYAYDYSEPDVPLVGQGMLSWAMDPQRGPPQQQQQLITGRVTRNRLALLNNGSRDMLEVKLKLSAVARAAVRPDCSATELANAPRPMPIPADTASEWNSFIQSNPMLGHAANTSTISSPALCPTQPGQHNGSLSENRSVEVRNEGYPPQQQQQRPGSIPPTGALPPVPIAPASRPQSVAPIPPRPQSSASNAPPPTAPQTLEPAPQPRPSRPASRSRSKQPTGRPRGRPRKRPLETGNTSAVEEATDADDGPQKRRAKVTRTEYSAIAPFGAAPESLRVAASTSGSLRAMRPVGAGIEGPAGSHLQDVPRAPTPIPDAQLLPQQQRRRALENHARAESMMSMDQSCSGRPMLQNLAQDARSPAHSIAHSPDHGYSPEDSAGDMNSSPPVPRASAYLRSSPPASSPTLPTVSMPPLDSGFMSGGLDDIFDDEDMLQRLTREQTQDQTLPVPSPPVAGKPDASKNGRSQQQQQPPSNFPFQEVNPGPPELLPTRSIFNPAGKAKTLNRHASAAGAQPVQKKTANRSLKRSNTTPNPALPVQEPPPQGQPTYDPSGNELSHVSPLPDGFQENDSSYSMHAFTQQPTENAVANGHADAPQKNPSQAPAKPMPIPQRPETGSVLPCQNQQTSRPPSRPASQGPSGPSTTMPTMPTSDSVTEALLTLPRAVASEPPCPPSDLDPPRYSKNLVKKQSIKERLQSAIEKGESPPFCSNCGAIETPTWRKIWTQDHEGVPDFHEFSDKPGCVTLIEVLERDENEQPTKYRMVKKNLGPMDDKKKWIETLLCNPCGIWLGKFKMHRPPDRWDKDAARLNQPRRKKGNASRSKKARTKSDTQANPTSEAYLNTDPFGPLDSDLPTEHRQDVMQPTHKPMTTADQNPLNFQSSPRQRFLGSTHSRGSGTADSPIAVEDELGSTRRLLFPSPRRDGVPKTLGELSLNSAQPAAPQQEGKPVATGKENTIHMERPGTPVPDGDLEQELFGTPPRRPSTPPPKGTAGPFKTPTRPTPSNRPITRSIVRSIRSSRSMPKSPGQLLAAHLLQQTPTKTPRSGSSGQFLHPSSASKRRTPRSNNDGGHFPTDANEHNQMSLMMHFDSPFTNSLQQLLSEANDFIGGSPSRPQHGGVPADLDLSNLTQLDMDKDFGTFLGTDLVMPSSPPLLRGEGGSASGAGVGSDGRNTTNGGGGGHGTQFGGVLQEEEMWARHLTGQSGEKEKS